MGNNFVNNAIFGTYRCSTCSDSVGQFEFFDDLMAWWDSLDDIFKYAMIAGVGLVAVVVVLAMISPAKARGVEQLEELLRLKMLKELAE